MLQYLIPIVASFLPFWGYALIYVFALSFLAFVINLISHLLRGA